MRIVWEEGKKGCMEENGTGGRKKGLDVGKKDGRKEKKS